MARLVTTLAGLKHFWEKEESAFLLVTFLAKKATGNFHKTSKLKLQPLFGRH